jgi:DNA polymerase-3 subunit gamma/tau
LLERLRDLLIIEKIPDAAAKGLIDAPADQLEGMVGQALRLGGASLSRMADVVHEGLVQMRGTASPRLLLELICARLLLPGADDSHGALLQRLERLERRFDIAGAAPPGSDRTFGVFVQSTDRAGDHNPESSPSAATLRPASAPPAVPRPASAPPGAQAPVGERPASAPPAGSVPPAASAPPAAAVPTHAPGAIDAAAVRRLWPEILERLKKRRVVWSLMQNATPRSVEGTELVLAVQHQGLARRFADEQVVRTLQEALHEVLGVRWSVRAVVDGAPEPPRPAARAAEPHAEQPDEGGWPTVRPVLRSVPTPVDDAPDPEPPPPDEYSGFDPGDEPADEPADTASPAEARRDTEAEAVALLEQQLGARKIGELN